MAIQAHLLAARELRTPWLGQEACIRFVRISKDFVLS